MIVKIENSEIIFEMPQTINLKQEVIRSIEENNSEIQVEKPETTNAKDEKNC